MNDVAVMSEYRDAPNERVVEKCERLLAMAKSGEMQGLVVLYDGTGGAALGYTEAGVWDSAHAVFMAECWKHHRVIAQSEADGD